MSNVKQLVWLEHISPRQKKPCDFWSAETPFGIYYIQQKKKFWVSFDGRNLDPPWYNDLETAKAEVQKDLTKQINLMLEAPYGWVAMDFDRKLYRAMDADFRWIWTTEPGEAVRYARRVDAEKTHAEDEMVWKVVPAPEEYDYDS